MNIFFMGAIGIILLIVGIYSRLGYLRFLYLGKGVAIFAPDAARYIFLPFGITCLLIELLGSDLVPFEQRVRLLNMLIGPSLGITVVLAIWQPKWLLPRWLQYLRSTYGYRMTSRLLEEASKDIEWSAHTATHEGLKIWAEETYQKLAEADRMKLNMKAEP